MRLFLLLFYLCPLWCFGQQNIKVIVVDHQQNPIAFASVQLIDNKNNQVLAYGPSNEAGTIQFKIAEKIDAIIEVNHLSYLKKTEKIVFDDTNNITLRIALESNPNILKEVIVQSNTPMGTQKGDTISYNLGAFTNGNEQKLKDVIAKLPGFEINDGKISANGKPINDLLVNGKKMFGDNHQIATDNISAKMLDGIDLLNNYESSSIIKDIEGSDRTALNIKIKKDYLGKITGNAEAFFAYKERYKAHGNLFRFSGKANISSIVDANNTGEQALSVSNYLNMSKNIKQDLRNNDASITDFNALNIPDFLLQSDKIKSNTLRFSSFDIAYQPTSKISINGYSIFNYSKTTESIQSNKTYFNSGGSIFGKDQQVGENKFLFNQSKFNVDYQPNNKSLINYSIQLDPNFTKRNRFTNNQIEGTNNDYDEQNKKFDYHLEHQLSVIKKVSKNELLSFNIYQDIKQNRNKYDVNATANLFDTDKNSLYQDKYTFHHDIGLYAKYTKKLAHQVARFNIGYLNSSNKFRIENESGTLNLKSNYLFSDVSILKKEGFFQYRLKTEIRDYFLDYQVEKTNAFQILPTAQIKLSFSDLHHLTLSYGQSIEYPKTEDLNNFNYANDFRNLVRPSSLTYNQELKQDNYSLNYLLLNLYGGTVLIANTSYTKYHKAISTNTNNFTSYNEIESTLSPNKTTWSSLLSFEQRISKLSGKLKASCNYLFSENYNFISSNQNKFIARSYYYRIAYQSKLKSSPFDFELGSNNSIQKTSFSLYSNENKINKTSIFLNIDSKLSKSLLCYINNNYEWYQTAEINRKIYNLGFKLLYDSKKSKLKYWLSGTDILNLNATELITVKTSNNVFSEDVLKRMSGFIGLGLSFDF